MSNPLVHPLKYRRRLQFALTTKVRTGKTSFGVNSSKTCFCLNKVHHTQSIVCSTPSCDKMKIRKANAEDTESITTVLNLAYSTNNAYTFLLDTIEDVKKATTVDIRVAERHNKIV